MENTKLSMSDLEALVSNKAKELSKPTSKAQKENLRKSNNGLNEASVAGDRFIESLGFDSDDDYVYEDTMNEPNYITEESLKRSNMPDEIKNMMAKTINSSLSSSVTNNLNKDGVKAIREIMKRTDRGGNNKEVKPITNTQTPQIDYPLLRSIIADCLKEQLNENSLKTIGIKAGVISLIDNSGNIYRAKLEKIGNKNDKS